MNNTLYDILGVAPDADQATIKQAYRHLMKRYHPDQDASAAAAVKFKEVRNAYDILGDATKRQQYDQQLANERVQGQPQQTYQTYSNNQNAYRQRPQNRQSSSTFAQQYWWTIPVALLAIVLIWTGYRGCANHFSYDAQLDNTTKILVEKDPQQLMTVVSSADNKNNPVTKSSIMPFYNYLHKSNKNMSNVVDALNNNSADAQQGTPLNLSFKRTGSQWLIFPKYQIELAPVAPTVKINQPNVTIRVGQTSHFTSDEQPQQKRLKPILPGLYNATATTKIKNQRYTQKVVWDAVGAQSTDAPIDLRMQIVTVTITSYIKNGTIYWQGKKDGKMQNGSATKTLLLSNNQAENQLQIKGKNAVSNPYPISTNQNQGAVSINARPTAAQETQEQAVKQFLSDLFANFSESQDSNLPINGIKATDYFKSGNKNATYTSIRQLFSETGGQVFGPKKIQVEEKTATGVPVTFKIQYLTGDGDTPEASTGKVVVQSTQSKNSNLLYQVVDSGKILAKQKPATQTNPDAGATTKTHDTLKTSNEPFSPTGN